MTDTSTPTLFCANHPTVETTLRCNRCEKPICVQCAVLTPTGYRCKECVKSQQKIFDTAEPRDYILGFLVAAILSWLASLVFLLISLIGFFGFIIAMAAAPTAGVIISEGVRLVTRKHRSRALFITIAVAVVLGSVPVILLNLHNMYGLIFQGIYLALVLPTVFYRLSGIRITK
jgi:uncharacterized BrkB/YihY/UPF0761 family membrane protein